MTDRLITTAQLASLALLLSSGVDAQRITRRESHGVIHNQVNVSTVVSAIGNTARVTARLHNIGSLSSDRIRVIDVRPFIAPARRAAYTDALETNRDRIELLRADLVALDPVVRVLAERRPPLTVDAVVAAGILDVIETGKSSNVLVLYVDRGNRLGMSSGASRTLTTFHPTQTGLMSALQLSPEMVARVSALELLRPDRVRFYDIDAILKPADADSYRAAVRQNQSAIRSLRSELSKRPLVMRALERHDAKLVLGDIFAADIVGDEDVLVLYYKRRTAADDSNGT